MTNEYTGLLQWLIDLNDGLFADYKSACFWSGIINNYKSGLTTD
jgi:hypothetical protein